MKSKLTKIWGVGLTVMLLAMLIGVAIPVSAATLGWSTVSAPSGFNNILVDNQDVDFLVMAPDGSTMFAYSNTGTTLYKSTDAGVTWTTSGITGPGAALVAMAISPDYVNDSTIVAASTSTVYRSINGGASFGTVATTDLTTDLNLGGTVEITSLDVAKYYLGGQLAILVGTRDTAGGTFGAVGVFRTDTIDWALQGALNFQDVMAVAFSPNHQSDAQILAVGQDGTDVILTTKFAGNAWGADVSDSVIAALTDAANPLTAATIAFPDDYEWSSNNRVLVGISSSHATLDDAFRVHGGQVPAPSTAYDLNVNGSSADTDVYSIDVKGPIATAEVLVGQSDSATVKRTSDVTASTVTWRSSVKAPTAGGATPNTIVLWSPTEDGVVYAGTGNSTGAEANAVSRSIDGGVTFNQLGLISVSSLAAIVYLDSYVVDANTMFLIVSDPAAAATDADEMLFKTTNGGTSWERILMSDDLLVVEASSDYANDQTVYVAESTTRLWKSTNGGESFVGLTAPAAITALKVVDKDTYFTGHANAVYRSGRWNSGSITGTVNSIAVSPNLAADDTVIVGTTSGDIYRSTNASATGGVTYNPVGAVDALGANNVIVAFDPGYASNNIVYAASNDAATTAATAGVFRYEIGTSAAWTQLDNGPNYAGGNILAATGMVITPDGTLYASSSDANEGVRREVWPTGPTALQVFESLTTDLTTSAALQNLQITSGSNVLYAIASGIATGSYGHGYRILTYTDTMAVTPELVGPKDGTITPSTSVTLSWKALEAPSPVTYTYDVSTDADFANLFVNAATTTGTSVTVTGHTSGTKYYWRVRATSTPRSKRTAAWTYTPALGTTGTASTTTAPAPGATGVILRPTFQWAAVGGASSYELELADNPFYANASVKKPLTHTVWTWDVDLEYSTTYYWRVRAVRGTNRSSWSEATFTTMDKPAPPAAPAAPPQITVQPAPPAPPPVVNVPPAPPSPVTPAVIWAIIIIGAVLVIAVIVLIVRTRRVP